MGKEENNGRHWFTNAESSRGHSANCFQEAPRRTVSPPSRGRSIRQAIPQLRDYLTYSLLFWCRRATTERAASKLLGNHSTDLGRDFLASGKRLITQISADPLLTRSHQHNSRYPTQSWLELARTRVQHGLEGYGASIHPPRRR